MIIKIRDVWNGRETVYDNIKSYSYGDLEPFQGANDSSPDQSLNRLEHNYPELFNVFVSVPFLKMTFRDDTNIRIATSSLIYVMTDEGKTITKYSANTHMPALFHPDKQVYVGEGRALLDAMRQYNERPEPRVNLKYEDEARELAKLMGR